MRRPQLIDFAMIAAAAGSYFVHIHGGPSLVGLLVCWVVWAVLWVAWGVRTGSLLGAVVSLAVLAMMLVGPRTDLGFRLQQDCFERKVQEATAAHVPERNIDAQGDDNCGLMRFSVQTQELSVHAPGAPRVPNERAFAVVFRGAGEITLTIFGGHGMIYSPAGVPLCGSGVVGATHGCRTERVGDSEWYYFSFTSNIN